MPSFNCECTDTTSNETLAQLRTRMLVRLGFSAVSGNPPPGMATLVDQFLITQNRLMYSKYPALRTRRFFKWTLLEGERFYGLRANDQDLDCTKYLDVTKPMQGAYLRDLNGAWLPLVAGIPPTFYTTVTQPGLPVRYEIRSCIEIFPAPDTGPAAATLSFTTAGITYGTGAIRAGAGNLPGEAAGVLTTNITQPVQAWTVGDVGGEFTLSVAVATGSEPATPQTHFFTSLSVPGQANTNKTAANATFTTDTASISGYTVYNWRWADTALDGLFYNSGSYGYASSVSFTGGAFAQVGSGYELWIKGAVTPEAFAADADKTTVDSELVFLQALADALDYYGKPSAAGVYKRANEYLGELIASTHTTRRYVPGARPLPPAVQPIFAPYPGEY